jgi:hypothetical protein
MYPSSMKQNMYKIHSKRRGQFQDQLRDGQQDMRFKILQSLVDAIEGYLFELLLNIDMKNVLEALTQNRIS